MRAYRGVLTAPKRCACRFECSVERAEVTRYETARERNIGRRFTSTNVLLIVSECLHIEKYNILFRTSDIITEEVFMKMVQESSN